MAHGTAPARAASVEGFTDAAAIITGAGSGMGRATALMLARRGLAVGVMDIDGAAAGATAAAIAAAGGKALALAVDVAKPRAVEAAVRRACTRLGPVLYLANLAGHEHAAPLEKISDAEWLRMFAISVNGTFFACRAALPAMMAQRFGRIVNMSSLHALRGQPEHAHYAAAKAAIMGLTKSLAREKARFNIRVNAVAPGPIDTPLWRGGRSGTKLRRDIAKRSTVIPLGRLGRPEEIAELIAFLLSERSSYMTGQIVSADGGEAMV